LPSIQGSAGADLIVQRKQFSDPFPRTIPDLEGGDQLEEARPPALPQGEDQSGVADATSSVEAISAGGGAGPESRLAGVKSRTDALAEATGPEAARPEAPLPEAAGPEAPGPEAGVVTATGTASSSGNAAALGEVDGLTDLNGLMGAAGPTDTGALSKKAGLPDIAALGGSTGPADVGSLAEHAGLAHVGDLADIADGGELASRAGRILETDNAPVTGNAAVAASLASGLRDGGTAERVADRASDRVGDDAGQVEELFVQRAIDLSALATVQMPSYQNPGAPAVDGANDVAGAASNVSAPSDGGVLESLARAALGQLIGRATSETRSGASSAGATTSAATRGAESQAREGSTAMTGVVDGARSEVQTALPNAASRGSSILSGVMSDAFGGVRSLLRSLAGPIRTKIRAWLASGGQTNLAAELLAPIRQAINRVVQRIRAAAQRVIHLILGVARRIAAMITGLIRRITALATRIIRTISQALRRVIETVRRLLNRVIDRIRSFASRLGSVIARFVDRILRSVRAAINRVITAVRRVIERVTRAVTSFIRAAAQAAVAFVQAVLRAVTAAIEAVVAAVRRIIERAVSLVARAIRTIANFITRLVQRAARAIADAVMWLVLEWLKPKIQAALATASEMIERIRLYGEQYIAAAREGVRRAQQLGRDILQSILKPEGDHFTIGITGGLGAAGGAYVAAAGGANVSGVLDIHVSYRHRSMRAYLTLGGEVSGGLGVGMGGGVSASGGLTYGWGSVLSYGSEPEMNESVGGWQVSGGIGVEVGGGALGRGSIGMGEQLSTNLGDVPAWAARAPFGYNPVTGFGLPPPGVPVIGGPGFPGTVPGTETPRPPGGGTWSEVGPVGNRRGGGAPGGAGVPGTGGPAAGGPAGGGGPGRIVMYVPEPPEHVSGSVFFNPTGNDQVGARGRRTLAELAEEAEATASGADRVQAEATVVGRASPRWRHPRPRRTPAEENMALSQRRATNTGQALHDAMRGRSVPVGSTSIVGAGAPSGPADSDRPRQRRADVEVAVTRYRTQPPPPPPPTRRPDSHAPTPPPGQLPSLGWDTTVSGQVGGEGGISAEATAQLSAGIAYTFPTPLWEHNIDETEAKGLRIVLGLYKVSLDVAHGNPIGFVRDAAGLVGGVEDIVGVELTDPIVNFVIPMPDSP
jgi:hypothetical protein